MLIVDSQVHIWNPPTAERPWPEGLKPQRAEPLGIDELLQQMAVAGVSRALLVPPRIEGGRNDLSLEAARRFPDRFAVMGKLDQDDPASPAKISSWLKQPGMLGMRFTLKRKLEAVLTENRMDWVWAAAELAGIPLYVSITQPNAHLIGAVAERHPALRLVIDHLAIESDKQKDEEAFAGIKNVLALAKLPNIAVKVTSMPGYTKDVYPYRQLHPYLRQVYDAFGPQRMFWGSDLSRLRGPYKECVTMFTEEMPWLSSDDLEWIMGRAVCEWVGWK